MRRSWLALASKSRAVAAEPPQPAETVATILGSLLHSDWAAQGSVAGLIANSGTSTSPLQQATTSRQPTFDGMSHTGDGTDDRLLATLNPPIAAGQRPYIFVVGRLTDEKDPAYLFGFCSSSGPVPDPQTIAISRAGRQWACDRDEATYNNFRAGAADTRIHVFEAGFTAGGIGALVVDGIERDSPNSSVTTADMEAIITHAIDFNSNSYASRLALQRMIVCSNEPTKDQKQRVRAVLKAQYSIPTYPIERVELFDMTTLNPQFGVMQSFGGGISDGQRYVYFFPALSHNCIARYDDLGDFDDPQSWTYFDLDSIGVDRSKQWGCFDGRYLYIAPYEGSDFVRYDTTAPFDQGSSYQKFDTLSVDPLGYGFTGMAYDGRYAYLIPSNNLMPALGVALRYDTAAPFDQVGSYQKFDCTTLHPDCRGFSLGGFDGRYVYFAPWDAGDSNATRKLTGRWVRFDSTGDFLNPADWQQFDIASLDPTAIGLSHCGFDGQYIYLTPVGDPSHNQYTSTFVRFDPAFAMDDPNGYTFFDASVISDRAVGYFEAVYDGFRYMYMIDFVHGVNLQFDTQRPFTDPEAWIAIDGASFLDGNSLTGHGGGVAHKGAVYIPPSARRHIVRINPGTLTPGPDAGIPL